MNDVDLTAIFEREEIKKVQRYPVPGKYSVVLFDGRCGTGRTIGEALEAAKHPAAENIRRAA